MATFPLGGCAHTAMKKPQTPPSKIGNAVEFRPPVSIGDAPPRKGVIKDEIWSDIFPDVEWGHYVYTSQLIEWESGDRSIRITYYYQPDGSARWLFGGQYSIEDSPQTIRSLLEATLQKREWYAAS